MVDKICKVVKKDIKDKYPYLDGKPYPVMARVTKVNLGSVNIRLLDKKGTIDTAIPEIPNIKTDIELINGDIVRVGFYYGDLSLPYIDAKVGA